MGIDLKTCHRLRLDLSQYIEHAVLVLRAKKNIGRPCVRDEPRCVSFSFVFLPSAHRHPSMVYHNILPSSTIFHTYESGRDFTVLFIVFYSVLR